MIELVPVVFPRELVRIGSHARQLCKGMPVGDIGSKDVRFNPLYWLALGLVDGPPARMLECVVRGWSVDSRGDRFERQSRVQVLREREIGETRRLVRILGACGKVVREIKVQESWKGGQVGWKWRELCRAGDSKEGQRPDEHTD